MRLHLTSRGASIVMLLFAASLGLSGAQEDRILARGQSHYQRSCSVCHWSTICNQSDPFDMPYQAGGTLAKYAKHDHRVVMVSASYEEEWGDGG